METSRSLCFFWGPDLDLTLYVRSCGNFILVAPDTELARRVDFGEIFWPVSGQGSFSWQGRRHTVQPGRLWYYPPGSFHEYHPLGAFHYCWLTIAGRHARSFFETLDIKPGLNRAGVCPVQLFESVGNDILHHTRRRRIDALNTAFQILTQSTLAIPTRDGQSPVRRGRRYIEDNFASPELDVAQVADYLRMHRGSFSRAFHREYNITAAEYIAYTRIRNAMLLLRDTSLLVREIAASCGFASANYFSKVFSHKTGMTPRRYRSRPLEASLSPKLP